MHILTTPATHTDPEDRELIESEGEGVAAFTKVMFDEQFVVETIHVIDERDNQPIELSISDYFSASIFALPWGDREITIKEMEDCAE